MSTKENGVLSSQGYPGTRDFYPDLQRERNWLNGKIHSVMRRFGYEEYGGPFLEPLELYASKSSEEIVGQQLYSFKDRGDRLIAIRPEMTPTLARMVAAKYRELPRPIRWYSIPTCMRYERPQRGRLREFDQLNVDVFGGNALDEDLEVVLTIVHLMREIGASDQDFEIKLNHRAIVNDFLLGRIGVSQEQVGQVLRLLDKIEKLKPEEFESEAKGLGLDAAQIDLIRSFMTASLSEISKILGENNSNVIAMMERMDVLQAIVGTECVRFDPGIMRGFDYYTGMVFEVFDTSPKNRRALFGGGRYENLVGAFGVEPLAGVGYGTSDVSLLNFCEVHGLMPELPRTVDVAVIRFSDDDRVESLRLAQSLREAGLTVVAPITSGRFGKQIQQAEKCGAMCVVFRGEEELKNGTFAVKWLQLGQQETFPLSELGVGFVEKLRRLKTGSATFGG